MWAYTDDEAGWLDLEHARRERDKRNALATAPKSASQSTETATDLRAAGALLQPAAARGTHPAISG